MEKIIHSIRGMHDILPEQTSHWQLIETALKDMLSRYGYQEIRFPMIERTELFSRSIGEGTDILEKEMYTFVDRNGDSLTLRPEGTASCVRASIQNGLLSQTQRLWYMGSMFRHERPQKDRYRQFQQLGVEAYGFSGPDIDVEIILMTSRMWKELGLTNLSLQINSLGSIQSRLAYRENLVSYFESNKNALDEDSRSRLYKNPLRILDSKNIDIRILNEAAPKLIDHLDEESKSDFDVLCKILNEVGIVYEINPYLVRGLDYYGKTVFEWVTDHIGSQNTICAGGRYDDLAEQLGGKAVTAMGFAIGLDRLMSLLNIANLLPKISKIDVYIISVGDLARRYSLHIAENLRDQIPELRLLTHCGSGGFKSQFKKADRSGARWALILGNDEVAQRVIGVKTMEIGKQETISWDALATHLISKLSGETK